MIGFLFKRGTSLYNGGGSNEDTLKIVEELSDGTDKGIIEISDALTAGVESNMWDLMWELEKDTPSSSLERGTRT